MTPEQKELAQMFKTERDRIYNLLATNKTQAGINHACLLAENMRDCKNCPFYTPKNDTVSLMKGK